MNWSHLNPNKSFVHPQNVTGLGIFSGIWQNAPQSNQDKQIGRYSHQCQERLVVTTMLESQTNASFMMSSPNLYFQSII